MAVSRKWGSVCCKGAPIVRPCKFTAAVMQSNRPSQRSPAPRRKLCRAQSRKRAVNLTMKFDRLYSLSVDQRFAVCCALSVDPTTVS
jgi:hypothetical protein